MSNFRFFLHFLKFAQFFYFTIAGFENICGTLPGVPRNIFRKKIKNSVVANFPRPAQSDPPPNRNAIFGNFAPGYARNLNPYQPRVQNLDGAPRDPQSLKISRKSPGPFSRYRGSKKNFQSPAPQKRGGPAPQFSPLGVRPLTAMLWQSFVEIHSSEHGAIGPARCRTKCKYVGFY